MYAFAIVYATVSLTSSPFYRSVAIAPDTNYLKIRLIVIHIAACFAATIHPTPTIFQHIAQSVQNVLDISCDTIPVLWMAL